MLKISLGRLRLFLSFLGNVQVASLKLDFDVGVDEAPGRPGIWRLAISIMAAFSVANVEGSTKCNSSFLFGFCLLDRRGAGGANVWCWRFEFCCGCCG